MDKITVGLIDDHAIVRKGLIALLNDGDVAEVILEAGSGEELMDKLKFQRPQVLLLDYSMPGMDGEQALKLVKKDYPEIKVLILSMNNDEQLTLHLIEQGANGYLLKESGPDEVELAIRSAFESGFYFNDRVSRIMLQRVVRKDSFQPQIAHGTELSERELEVLELICAELTTAEIGEKLFISPRTVEGHRKKIQEKMGVRNTAGMVVYALKKGLVRM